MIVLLARFQIMIDVVE